MPCSSKSIYQRRKPANMAPKITEELHHSFHTALATVYTILYELDDNDELHTYYNTVRCHRRVINIKNGQTCHAHSIYNFLFILSLRPSIQQILA